MARRLNIEIAIDSRKAVAGGKQAEAALGGVAKKGAVAGSALGGLRAHFLALGTAAVIAAVYAPLKAITELVDVIGKASREFADFDQALRNVGAVSGATREEIAALSDEALRLAKATRFSPEQTAQALYSLASAGQSASEQIASLPAVLDFAEAAQADLGLSTELVVRSLKSFNLEADQARRIADVMTASISASSLNAERLSYGMAQAAPAAAVLGQSVETTTAALALLVDRLGSGEMAGAGLKQSMLTLMNSAEDLGIQVVDSGGKFRDLVDIIRDLEGAGAQGEQILQELGTRAGPAMSILVSQGADALADMRDAITSNGQAARIAGEQLDTLKGDMDQLASAQDEFWKVLGAQVGDGMRDATQVGIAAVSAATDAVRANGDEMSAAWSGSIDSMIDSTRMFAIMIARLIDLVAALDDQFGLLSGAIQGVQNALHLTALRTTVELLARLVDTTPGLGPAEAAVRKFFDALEDGANGAATAVERLSDFDAIVNPLRRLGVEAKNLMDIDDLNRILEELDKVAAQGSRTVPKLANAAADLARQAREAAQAGEEFVRKWDIKEVRPFEVALDQRRVVEEFDQAIADQLESADRWRRQMEDIHDAIFADERDQLDASIKAWAESWIAKQEEAARFEAEIKGILASALVAGILSGGDGVEEAFENMARSLARILEEQLADALADVFEGAEGAWKNLSKLFQGGAGTALALGVTASNIQGANDQGYAAVGAAVGAALGAALGSLATTGFGAGVGAKWGAVIGSWLGGMISKGAPRFFGSLKEEAGKINLVGELASVGGSMGADIREGVEKLLSALGGELEGLGVTIGLEMREGLAVTVDGIRTYFDKEHISEGIQFAIVEALKNADISGISDEARAALNNTMADTMEELLSDLDFARWIEQLNLTDSAKALDDFVDQFRVAWDRMVSLGIDGAEKLAQWAAKSLEDQRRSILGIQETAAERIKREAAAFNTQLQLIEAEQMARRADLMIRKAELEARVDFARANAGLVDATLQAEGGLLKGRRDILQGNLALLDAVNEALEAVDILLGSLPDLISNDEIERAIRRAGRGAGGPTGPTQDDRDAALAGMQDFGLSDAARQLAAATRFVQEHMQTVAELGFSEEDLMEIRRKAQAEQDKMIRDLGRGALAALGSTSVATIQRMQDLGLQLKFLRENFEELGLQLWQVEAAAAEVGKEITLSIASGLAQYIDDADTRRQLQILEHDLFMHQKSIEIQAAYTMGLITQEQLNFLQGVLDLAMDWTPPEILTPPPQIRNSFADARRDAERIAESFARAKGDLADFLNSVLRGDFGGTSPVGGVLEAQRQYDEVLRQAQSGNIGAISELGDYGATLLRMARDAYASGPEFQAIRDYVLASGADILALRQGREGNVVFDERFFSQGQQQISEQQRMNQTLAKIEQHLARRSGGAIVTGGVGG